MAGFHYTSSSSTALLNLEAVGKTAMCDNYSEEADITLPELAPCSFNAETWGKDSSAMRESSVFITRLYSHTAEFFSLKHLRTVCILPQIAAVAYTLHNTMLYNLGPLIVSAGPHKWNFTQLLQKTGIFLT